MAATSRARPSTDKQSARLGVSLSVSTTSSRSSALRTSVPIGMLESRIRSPLTSSEMPSSLAEHSIPCDSTPRIAVLRISSPPGSVAPMRAHGTTIPAATLGAPQTIDKGSPVPASTRHTVRRSALGWRSTSSTCAATTPLNAGAAFARSSTSRPAMVSAWASASLSSGGSTKVRSQCSENFISRPSFPPSLVTARESSGFEGIGSRSRELPEESQIILVEHPQVVDAVTQHRQPICTHAEGEALIALGIDADRSQDVGMNLPRAGDLQPPFAERHVDFRRRLRERKERRTEADLEIVTLEQTAKKLGEYALEIGEGDVLVDPQTFDLMEHRRMRRVAVHAIHAAGDDDLDWRRVRFHVSHLDRRGVRAQHHAAFDIKGVVHRARRVVFRRVERGEVVEVVLDFRSLGNGEAKRVEQRLDAIDRAGNRVQCADRGAASGKRNVERFRGKLRAELGVGDLVAAAAERRFELGFCLVDARSRGGTLHRG